MDLDPTERAQARRRAIELINHSLRGFPPDRIRYHTCYSINQGPHIYDLHLRDFIGRDAPGQRAGGLVRGDEPRHMHDYHAFEDVKLPDGK